MKYILIIFFLWTEILFASSSLDDQDLGAWDILLFGAFAILFLVVIYVLPVWLTFRVKKIFIDKKLTKNKLSLHVLPAIIFGCWGLSDLLNPEYFDEATIKNYFGMIINIAFVYLGVTTYLRYSGEINT